MRAMAAAWKSAKPDQTVDYNGSKVVASFKAR